MRTINAIANEIKRTWVKPSPHAVPYISAMHFLSSLEDNYYCDSADDIILRFLCNASTWRGEDARRIKKELNDMLKAHNTSTRSVAATNVK